jgi:hypothetical protein
MAEIEKKTKRYPHANAFKITRLPGLGNHVNDQGFLVEQGIRTDGHHGRWEISSY